MQYTIIVGVNSQDICSNVVGQDDRSWSWVVNVPKHPFHIHIRICVQFLFLMKLFRIFHLFQFLFHTKLYHSLAILLAIAFYCRGFEISPMWSLGWDTCCVTLGNSHALSEPRFPLQNWTYLPQSSGEG